MWKEVGVGEEGEYFGRGGSSKKKPSTHLGPGVGRPEPTLEGGAEKPRLFGGGSAWGGDLL